uniref:Bradykinin-potentiating peptide 11i n=1 Tax=Bothrops jararaca TaxID=8724 RepID=BPPBI_BOTJA|nr:RecName: Full=Bradykinin-potentiating peptide 11i; Short=BPP-11i [Bothrops jararaca]
QNGPRPIGIPP